MNVLLCHNFYKLPGGEDRVFDEEAALLESRGHKVVRYTLDNHAINRMGRLAVARVTLWNPRSYHELRALIRAEQPVVMHCHNIFPLISPAAYDAARASGVAVVQTLHNFRWLCPASDFLRDNRVCEDCLVRRLPWPGVRHRCYQNSFAASVAVAGMIAYHRVRATLRERVHRFITPSAFARRKFLAAGWPAEKLTVKPNFVHPDPGIGQGRRGDAVFVGRLSRQKGIETLLAAWRRVVSHAASRMQLRIIGDGPLRPIVEHAAAELPSVEFLGQQSADRVLDALGEAACVLLPSIGYETFGRTIVEAFSRGTPAVASRLGAMDELVADGCTGLLAEPGDADSLADAIGRLANNPEQLATMRHAARAEFEKHYSADANYEQLVAIYRAAIEAR